MDLHATRMFVAAVQAGSLSAAAARLNLPMPTISRRIRQLEQQLKVQLLERSPKGISLTDAGARLYQHASRGLEALAEGAEAVRSDQARLSSGKVTETYSTSTNNDGGYILGVTNANTDVSSITVNGLDLTLTNATNTNNTNTINGINLTPNNNNSNVINGINISNATGFTNFLSTPSIDISAAGAITGAPFLLQMSRPRCNSLSEVKGDSRCPNPELTHPRAGQIDGVHARIDFCRSSSLISSVFSSF